MSVSNNVILCVPSQSDSSELHTDASREGIGGVLYVNRDNRKLPVAFHSRQLRAKQNYSVTELETLAILDCTGHFLYYLFGRPFVIITDHIACYPCLCQTSCHLGRGEVWGHALLDSLHPQRHRPPKLRSLAQELSHMNC